MDKVSYDVAVVGSGMGGLCAASLLANAGYRVLVIEKLPRVGGRCSTIDFKGFKCPTAAISPETGATLEGVYRETGAEFNVRPLQKVSFRIGGKKVYPGSGGIKNLMAEALSDNQEVERLFNAYKRAMRWSNPSRHISLRGWLNQYTDNQAVRGLFGSLITAVLLVNIDEVTAYDYFEYMKVGGKARAGYPPAGSLGFIEPLAKVVKANHGDVWTGAAVTKINVSDGVATGVTIKHDNDEISVESRAVISNTGPSRTVDLTGEQFFDRGYLKELRQNLKPVPMFWFHIQSDYPLIEDDAVMTCDTRRIVALFNPTRLCPELAPKGKHLMLAHGTLTSSLPPYNLEREIDLNLRDLEECLPGFNRHKNLLLVSTFQGDWPAGRSWPGLDMPQKTSIEYLYNVGDGARPPGMQGLPSCAASARLVADDIRNRIKLS